MLFRSATLNRDAKEASRLLRAHYETTLKAIEKAGVSEESPSATGS